MTRDLSQRAFAEMAEVSNTTVARAIKTGRIAPNADGTIPIEQLAWFHANRQDKKESRTGYIHLLRKRAARQAFDDTEAQADEFLTEYDEALEAVPAKDREAFAPVLWKLKTWELFGRLANDPSTTGISLALCRDAYAAAEWLTLYGAFARGEDVEISNGELAPFYPGPNWPHGRVKDAEQAKAPQAQEKRSSSAEGGNRRPLAKPKFRNSKKGK